MVRFLQQTSVALEDVSRIGQLALSLVKSRIFLDCLTETPAPIIYTCVAETDFSKIESSTTVKVVRPEQQIDSNGNFFNKEAEFYANQNSIDLSSKPDSLYAMESTLTGCLSKQSLGRLAISLQHANAITGSLCHRALGNYCGVHFVASSSNRAQ